MTGRIRSAVLLVVGMAIICGGNVGCGRAVKRAPTNVIVLIGDGMGFEHVKAGGLYANGQAGSLFLETLPGKGQSVTTPIPEADADPDKIPITDSAAGATAPATGHKVRNGVISLALPGDGSPYKTALERFKTQGKKTGLVTTSYITDATPAAFGAHTSNRGNRAEIVKWYLKKTRPNVLMGGGDDNKEAGLTPEAIRAAGYQLVTDREELAALLANDPGEHVFGIFGQGSVPYEAQKAAAATQPDQADILNEPSLSEMADAALKLVSREKKGFFLMIEGGLIDWASHSNDVDRCMPEVAEFDKAVKVVMDWAAGRKDTLVIVVADHETGGLKVVKGCGKGQIPEVTWSTKGHTGANVPLFVWGVGAEKVNGVLDNTDVFRLMMGTFEKSSVGCVECAGASN